MKKTECARNFRREHVLMWAFLAGSAIWNPLASQILAFPGAEGFRAYSRGGRGGDVYTVTELTDYGPGSLRYYSDGLRPQNHLIRCIGPDTAQNELFVDLTGFSHASIRIVDIAGNSVYCNTGSGGVERIDVRNLVPGIYQVVLTDETDEICTHKLINN